MSEDIIREIIQFVRGLAASADGMNEALILEHAAVRIGEHFAEGGER